MSGFAGWRGVAGTVGAAALACAAVGYVRRNAPLAVTLPPPLTRMTATTPHVPTAADAGAVEAPMSKPAADIALLRPAALGTSSPPRPRFTASVHRPTRPAAAAASSVVGFPPFHSGRQTDFSLPDTAQAHVPTSVIVPPRKPAIPETEDASPLASTTEPTTISLDDDSRTVVVPIVVAEPETNGSDDIRLIPAALTLPADMASSLPAPSSASAPIDLSE